MYFSTLVSSWSCPILKPRPLIDHTHISSAELKCIFFSGLYLVFYHVVFFLFMWAYWQTIFTDVKTPSAEVSPIIYIYCCNDLKVFWYLNVISEIIVIEWVVLMPSKYIFWWYQTLFDVSMLFNRAFTILCAMQYVEMKLAPSSPKILHIYILK